MELMQRDLNILMLVGRFTFMTGKVIKEFYFSSDRTKERRLKILVDSGYLKREKILYGYPYFYTLTHKGRILIGLNKKASNVRIERIKHDLIVLDVLIQILEKYQLTINDIMTEKELHRKDGFSRRKHHPDFIFTYKNQTYAVEIELTVKAKDVLNKNIQLNYMAYDYQLWFVEKNNKKLIKNLDECGRKYDSISIHYLGD